MNVNNKDRALLYWAGGHRTPGPLTSDWPAAARPLAASFSCSLPIGQRLSLLRPHWSVNRSYEVTMNHPRNKNCRNVSRHLTPADATLILRWGSLLTLQLDTCVCNCDDGQESVGSFKMNDSPSKVRKNQCNYKSLIAPLTHTWAHHGLCLHRTPVTWHTTHHTPHSASHASRGRKADIGDVSDCTKAARLSKLTQGRRQTGSQSFIRQASGRLTLCHAWMNYDVWQWYAIFEYYFMY